MSDSPVTWQELDAYIERTVAILSPGACEAIIDASREFTGACRSYHGQAVPPPNPGEEEKARHRQKIESAIVAGFRQFATKDG